MSRTMHREIIPPLAPPNPADHPLRSRLEDALTAAERHLLGARQGIHWRGELSSSALSTATAAFALTEIDRQRGDGLPRNTMELADGGLRWLANHANPDGGWGDTTDSQSNLSTTLLAWAALEARTPQGLGGPDLDRHRDAIEGARRWITQRAGSLERDVLRHTVEDIYGEDRTFSIPILTLCSLAGVLGPREEAFRDIIRLPFELAAFPQSWFRFMGLPVVSYALPALIAIGQVQHHHHRPAGPLGALRDRMRQPTLKRLTSIQPSSGGFLEAIPLTSFVAMGLAGAGEANHPVVDLGLEFLEGSVRPDGSWPIDIDLATWVTTLSIQALAAGKPSRALTAGRRSQLWQWLMGQQHREVHPFTGAAPGGWAWTDLPGGVPDADDTAGALLALRALMSAETAHTAPLTQAEETEQTLAAAEAGLGWLLDLQNRDGGIPTFCRGWGKLPFDRSAPDLTAHALRAIVAWESDVGPAMRKRLARAKPRLLDHLRNTQRPNGSWIPLWFGNEAAPDLENPTYGTSRVLRALEAVATVSSATMVSERRRAETWLIEAQHPSGGWGGAPGVEPSVEETALALDALAGAACAERRDALERGAQYLCQRLEEGGLEQPSPIGFYFANLWYSEEMYPVVYSVSALRRLLLCVDR